jgi:hypothetical protein
VKAPFALLAFLVVAPIGAAQDFKPLWDGATLSGWHAIGKGEWKIRDGAIHGSHANSEKHYGHLVTDRAYTNFTVRLKFKSLKGNSGFYFRTEEKGAGGVSGFQAEIDPKNDLGGLYETNGRGWVAKPKTADIKQWFKPGDWNEMVITAIGRRITVEINGHRAAELPNDTLGRLHGKFALQLHGSQDVDVWFKGLEIAER